MDPSIGRRFSDVPQRRHKRRDVRRQEPNADAPAWDERQKPSSIVANAESRQPLTG
jgi:hypothetical protein